MGLFMVLMGTVDLGTDELAGSDDVSDGLSSRQQKGFL